MSVVKTDEEISDKLVSDLLERQYSLILYDDPKITQDLVLGCLTKYCGHDIMQALQCINIIESVGKYAVKIGSVKTLTPIFTAMTHNKLTCEIR